MMCTSYEIKNRYTVDGKKTCPELKCVVKLWVLTYDYNVRARATIVKTDFNSRFLIFDSVLYCIKI